MIFSRSPSQPRPRVVALRGPVLGGGRRRRSGVLSMQTLGLLALAGICVWLWQVIGADLGNGRHLGAKHDDGKAAAQAEVPIAAAVPHAGGPSTASLPARKADDGTHAGLDPVAQALLSGARDQLARKVAPVTVAVDDPHAAKASPFDLVDRGLSDLLPLRTALLRHRQRDPHLYGLTARPSQEDRRRALTGENLATFLEAFATHLDDQAPLEAGDVVVVQRNRRSSRPMPAVVSDAVDETGAPLVITLDPADKVAREQGLGNYAVKQRFRLRAVDLERMRSALDLGELHAGAPGRAL